MTNPPPETDAANPVDPQPVERPFLKELASQLVQELPRTLGSIAVNFLGIIGLIVLGAVGVASGLLFQSWLFAIAGGVLILSGIVWGAVLLLLFDW